MKSYHRFLHETSVKSGIPCLDPPSFHSPLLNAPYESVSGLKLTGRAARSRIVAAGSRGKAILRRLIGKLRSLFVVEVQAWK